MLVMVVVVETHVWLPRVPRLRVMLCHVYEKWLRSGRGTGRAGGGLELRSVERVLKVELGFAENSEANILMSDLDR
ncbi:hypothetical protein BHE74_00041948 [Ensete ventricosum]|nr:hypothetical protein BHE74_00041948 [Ensete ventricosum]RZR88680.1 hypothetical protein BHM03_00016306 [Ensete ventricosum]